MIFVAYSILIISLMAVVIILQHHSNLDKDAIIKQYEDQNSKDWDEVNRQSESWKILESIDVN